MRLNNKYIFNQKYIKDVFLLLEVTFANFLYVLGFYIIFQLNFNTFIYSIAHSVLSIIVMFNILCKFQKSHLKNNFSIASITLLITNVYFMLSSVKYVQTSLYLGFVEDNNYRLLGSIFIMFCILITTNIWFAINSKRSNLNLNLNISINLKGSIIYLGIILLISYYVVQYIRNPISVYLVDDLVFTAQEQMINLFMTTITYLFMLLACLYYDKKRFLTKIPLILIIILFLGRCITSGSRSAFVFPFFSIAYIMLYINKMKVKNFINAIIVSPFIYILFSALVFIISGRYTTLSNSILVKDISYRFDLSDYPFAVMKNTSYFKFDSGQLFDGFKISIPSVLWDDKGVSEINSTQQNLLINSGLNPAIDYTDSFFSMGAELAGLPGMFAVYLLIIICFEYIDRYLTKKKSNGFICKIIIFDVITRIEANWTYFIPSIRNKIICIIIVYILFLQNKIIKRERSISYEDKLHF